MARLACYMRAGLRLATLVGMTVLLAVPPQEAVAGVDLPKLEQGKGGKCVEDTEFMRRNHMELLKHHRNDTLRKGIRTTRHSLKGCVECHAGTKTGSVASSKEDFCMACHSYAGVKLDCWDCHATKPGKRPVHQTAQPALSPLMPSQGAGR